jgi:ribosomal protein S18 acetylase RimI-like enzyme
MDIVLDTACSSSTLKELFPGLIPFREELFVECASVLHKAFVSDPFWAWNGSDVGWLCRYVLRFCLRNGVVVLSLDENQKVAACMCLVGCGHEENDVTASFVLSEVGFAEKDGKPEATSVLRRVQREVMSGNLNRWHLWMIGTDPSFQGRGHGSRLLMLVCYLSDRDQVPVYLETDSAAALYKKHGFESKAQFRVGDFDALFDGK